MKNIKLNIENFKAEKIDRNQQKSIRGGDDTTIAPPPPAVNANAAANDVDPIKGGTGSVG
ncbi:hypothetical protein [Flavobacterium johnsoniae]|jgi:hypothetical protein|uniref:Uncharacterized protein n=1 Tax=Flavobacterium johnsoniae TaxID=986 RepID=A0A1J7BVH8_FLAJO|nr:hypothetical protein [Flavobacterium johnsoniae]OIV42694.1 hypothetical protein BKM63_07420 [Flavobacterium johnsoniae]